MITARETELARRPGVQDEVPRMKILFQLRIGRYALNLVRIDPKPPQNPATKRDRNKKTAEGDASAVKVEVTNVIQN